MSDISLLETRGEECVQKGLLLLRDKDQAGHGFQQLPVAGEKFLYGGSLEEEDLSLGESLCKARDSHLFKVEEGCGMWSNSV